MTREDEGAKDLLDTDLRDEIELVSDLVVAASGTDRHFTPDEVDALLGLQDATAATPVVGLAQTRTSAPAPTLAPMDPTRPQVAEN